MPTVLVTGAGGGIGLATVLRLCRRPSVTVLATARRPESLAPAAAAGARVLRLDVADEDSMVAAVATAERNHGGVDLLVNNAGYGLYGTIEEADLGAVREQFETNVFGLARMCQLVLPGMRQRGSGRIVNIGSMGGRVVFPAGGYYHASKYAVEALSDALRFEVALFGISVSLVEPGLIRTQFETTAVANLAGSTRPGSAYSGLTASVAAQMVGGYASPALSAAPELVAAVVEKALFGRRPRSRYVVTPGAKALVHIRRLVGGRAFDLLLRQQFPA